MPTPTEEGAKHSHSRQSRKQSIVSTRKFSLSSMFSEDLASLPCSEFTSNGSLNFNERLDSHCHEALQVSDLEQTIFFSPVRHSSPTNLFGWRELITSKIFSPIEMPKSGMPTEHDNPIHNKESQLFLRSLEQSLSLQEEVVDHFIQMVEREE